MSDMPVRADSPRRLDLEQQKKRAKELKRAVEDRSPDALRRVRMHHPKAREAAVERLTKLSDAQLVIARELGLPSWPRLKAHIEGLAKAEDSIAGGAAPDDRRTLHIRCGSDIREKLTRAGFAGDFLEFADPYCQGPVPRDGDLLSIRAAFVASRYGLSREESERRLKEEYEGLAKAPTRYGRLALWFEHDSYDQLVLARVLAEFEALIARPAIELICVDHFPAIDRFIGLGQLDEVELRLLWSARKPVTEDQLRLGVAAWSALRDPSPASLAALAATGTPMLPEMAPALRRHLQELPWTGDGLSLTQRLSLQALATGSRTFSQIFAELSRRTEPRPFLGDRMLWTIIEEMTHGDDVPIVLDPATEADGWPNRRVSLTETGRALLDGKLDWLTLNPPERWIGGVRIVPGSDAWRWSPERDGPVPG